MNKSISLRRTYKVNQELADELRAGYTIIVGNTTIWTPSAQIIRKNAIPERSLDEGQDKQ